MGDRERQGNAWIGIARRLGFLLLLDQQGSLKTRTYVNGVCLRARRYGKFELGETSMPSGCGLTYLSLRSFVDAWIDNGFRPVDLS